MLISKKTYRGIIENLYDGLYLVDTNRVITYWNKAAERISGYTAAEVVGRSCAENILTHVDKDGNNLCNGMCPLAETIADRKSREANVFLHHKDGHRLPISVRVSAITDARGKIIGGAELFTDTSSSQAVEEKIKELEEIAFLDGLTRLANRSYINRELDIRFAEHKRFRIPFGILFMDIDNFKKFNDTYGHDVGDRVLKFVADTMTKNARPYDLFGRWGGEEFIGILRNVSFEQIVQLGDRLRSLIEKSYIIHDERPIYVTISIGATLMRENDDIDALIKRADSLLYESKRQGRNRLTAG